MSKVDRRNSQYEDEREGLKAFQYRIKKDKKKESNVPNRKLFYKKGFLPDTIDNLDIEGSGYLNYISLRDYLQVTYGNLEASKFLKNSINRVSYELNDTGSKQSIRIYFKKDVGQLPTVLDAFLYDMRQGEYVEHVSMSGELRSKTNFTTLDITTAYQRIAQALQEDEYVKFAAFEYVKIQDKVFLNNIFLYPPYPKGLGFGPDANEYLKGLRFSQIWRYKRYRKSRFSRRFHRFFFNIQRFFLVTKGFTAKRAELWLYKLAVDKEMTKGESGFRIAKRQGYSLSTAKRLGINMENCDDYISEKDYYRLVPINLKYQKWIATLPTMYYVFKPFRDYMAKFYYHIMVRDGEALILPYGDQQRTDDYYTQIKELLDAKGSFTVVNIYGKRIMDFHSKYGEYFAGNRKVDFIYIWKYLTKGKQEMVIVETKDDAYSRSKVTLRKPSNLYLYIYNRNGQGAHNGGGRLKIYNNLGYYTSYAVDGNGHCMVDGREQMVDKWDEIQSLIERIGRHVPQLEFFGMELELREDSIEIKNMANHPEYITDHMFSKEVVQFLKEKTKEKTSFYGSAGNAADRGASTGKRRFKHRFAQMFYPKGLVPYISVTWPRDILKDLFTNKDCSLSRKKWAYKNGFLSYRLDQYGITPDNWENYISDFEYKWIRHINPYYKTWMEDKITLKYIANRYNQYFPGYYYHVICKNGEMNIIPLMDCPEQYGRKLEDIISLVKDKKVMAFKPDEGSHGDGFFRCDYKDEKFYINYEEATEQDIIDRLSKNDSAYIITEYIQMHPQLKEIYSGSVNTIRMIVFKRDGIHPEIGNTYIRIGTSMTGTIDNISAGGMFATIDPETGRYGHARIFLDGDIRDCDHHPDTGTLIEGTIPNWELTKKLVLDIASEIQELEWFGFDLAVTENGIKIPEINRSPDYPKMEKYTRPVIDYLLYKLDCKKQRYGYDRRPNHTLVHLPYRTPKEK